MNWEKTGQKVPLNYKVLIVVIIISQLIVTRQLNRLLFSADLEENEASNHNGGSDTAAKAV